MYKDRRRQTLPFDVSFWRETRRCIRVSRSISLPVVIMLGFFTISTMICLTMRVGILGTPVDNSSETGTGLHYDYVNCHEGLDSTYGKFPSSILGESINAEIEPTLRVDAMLCLDTIINAAESVLDSEYGTWNSDIWRTSWMLPDSKPQSRWM